MDTRELLVETSPLKSNRCFDVLSISVVPAFFGFIRNLKLALTHLNDLKADLETQTDMFWCPIEVAVVTADADPVA